MNFFGTARLALSRIWATKVRSLLTMLGVVIGVAAIVALTSIVDGASQGINRSLATLGTNQLNISSFGPNALTEQDARALAELEGVSVMFMQSQNEGTIATADNRVEARLVGVSADYFEAVKPVLAMGSYLSSNPAALNSRDVVFGADAATIFSIFVRTRALCSSDKVRKSPRAMAKPGMILVLPFALTRTPSVSKFTSCPAATKPTLNVRFCSGSSVRNRCRMRASSKAAPSP